MKLAPMPNVVAYTAPFVSYLTLTVLAARFPQFYLGAYSLAVLAAGAITWAAVRGRGILAPHRRVVAAAAIGVVGIVLWIALSLPRLELALASYLPSWLAPSPRLGFNPFEELSSPLWIALFIVVRLVGLVVLTPIAEELFWRGFLLRWLISPDWETVPIGRFSPGSFLGVTLLFALAHAEWLAAAAYCILLNGLLYWKKDLWSCVIAHAASNLLLAAYILATGTWWLW
jgi:CAAX prenyl protease-like protein